MRPLSCSVSCLIRTIDRLRHGGPPGEERVVLWLAPTNPSRCKAVEEVYEPEQVTAEDFFHLPPESMRRLMGHLREERLRVVAQVHTHPGEAFHSKADDKWAIVRHRGALSLVLPRFAEDVEASTFLDAAKVYELSPNNEWVLVPGLGEDARIEVTP